MKQVILDALNNLDDAAKWDKIASILANQNAMLTALLKYTPQAELEILRMMAKLEPTT